MAIARPSPASGGRAGTPRRPPEGLFGKAKTAALFGLNTEGSANSASPAAPLRDFELINGGLVVFPGGLPTRDKAQPFPMLTIAGSGFVVGVFGSRLADVARSRFSILFRSRGAIRSDRAE